MLFVRIKNRIDHWKKKGKEEVKEMINKRAYRKKKKINKIPLSTYVYPSSEINQMFVNSLY